MQFSEIIILADEIKSDSRSLRLSPDSKSKGGDSSTYCEIFESHNIIGGLFMGYVVTSVDAVAERRASEGPLPVDALNVTSRTGSA